MAITYKIHFNDAVGVMIYVISLANMLMEPTQCLHALPVYLLYIRMENTTV